MQRFRARCRAGVRKWNWRRQCERNRLGRGSGYGGKTLRQALTADGALEKDAAWTLLQQGDPGMAEICRASFARLATEVRNSIGFFEGQREESISRVCVSGGLARIETILQ